MKKKSLFIPIVSLSSTPGDDIVIGGGSGEGGSDIVPYNYTSWVDSAGYTEGYDFNEDGTFDVAEYCAWWADQMEDNPNVFTMQLWTELNEGLEWDDTWIG